MKSNIKNALLFSAAFVVVAAAATGSAFAQPAPQPLSFIGDPAPAQSHPDQVVVVTDKTPYVNVTGGSTVRFVVGGRSFNWTFDNPGQVNPFDLERLAPKGALHHPVEVYVSPNPLYEN